MPNGISKEMFVAGIVMSILVSTLTASALSFQYAGLQGPQGSQGLQGLQGVQGAQGVQGEQGPQGIQGIQGSQGFNGSQGIQGVAGTQGPQGIQGEQGIQGLQGIQGETGPQGIQGEQGPQGETGPQGANGTIGATGPQGPAGVFTIANMSGYVPAPAYDSGWMIPDYYAWNTFVHNLNTTNLYVYILGQYTGDNLTIHQLWLYSDVQWMIDGPNEIKVNVGAGSSWETVRVMLWKIAEP